MTLDEGPNTIGDFYVADSRMRGQLDGARLYVRAYGARGAYVTGKIVLNRHPQGVGKQLLALMGSEREEYEFQIPRLNLLTGKGEPNIDGALPSLKSIMARALPPEDVNARTLLRPSFGIEDRSTLLRPASSNSSAPNSILLHPAIPPESQNGGNSNFGLAYNRAVDHRMVLIGGAKVTVGVPSDYIQAFICGEEGMEAAGGYAPAHARFQRIYTSGRATLAAPAKDNPDSFGWMGVGRLPGIWWNVQVIQARLAQAWWANEQSIRATVNVLEPSSLLDGSAYLKETMITLHGNN